MLQLEFFEKTETERLKEELERVIAMNDKLRKALFARHGELAKHYLDLSQRLDIIERNICHMPKPQRMLFT